MGSLGTAVSALLTGAGCKQEQGQRDKMEAARRPGGCKVKMVPITEVGVNNHCANTNYLCFRD